MGLVAEGPQDEEVQTLKEEKGVIINTAAVGYIGQRAKPISQDFLLPVIDLYGGYLLTEELELPFNNVSVYLRDTLAVGRGGKDVFENIPQTVDSWTVAVARYGAFLKVVVYSHLVQSEYMVGMGMGKEDGIDAIDAISESLLAEVSGGVDEDVSVI